MTIKEYNWVCRGCGKEFTTRRLLQAHRKEVHVNNAGKSIYAGDHTISSTKCKFCERVFTNSLALSFHENRCSNNPNKIESKGHPVSDEVKQRISQKMKEIYKGKSIWATQIEKRKSYAEQYFDKCFPEAQKNYHVNRFFLDYAWPEKKCYIEVDGEQHYTEKGLIHDKERTSVLREEGWVLVSRIRWSKFQKLSFKEREDFIENIKKSIDSKEIIEIILPIKEKTKRPSLKEIRWELLQNSNIDFNKFGWVKQVSSLFGISENKAGPYIRRNYPDFYKTCFKRK